MTEKLFSSQYLLLHLYTVPVVHLYVPGPVLLLYCKLFPLPDGRVSDETEPPTESTMAAILGISAIPLGLLAGGDWGPVDERLLKPRPAAPGALPTVTAHGMGDTALIQA